jgi:hypothetical protein
MWLSAAPYHFISHRSNHSSLHSVLGQPQSLLFSFYVRDQVSEPYKATGKIIVLFILIFTFFLAGRKKRF